MTLRKKLLLWYSGVFFASAAFLVSAMYLLIAHKVRSEFSHHLRDEYEEALRIVAQNVDDPVGLKRDAEVEVLGRKFFPLSYELYDVHQGEHLLLLAPEWADRLPLLPGPEQATDVPALSKVRVGDDADEIAYFKTGWANREHFPGVVLRVGMSYERVYERLEKMGEYLAYALLVSLLISFTGARFLAARSLDPVDEIASALERIEAEKLSDRLPGPETQDEVGRIVSSVNSMLARLEESFAKTRAFTADVAHELRTPLAALKVRLEVAAGDVRDVKEYEEVVADALREVNDLDRVVDDLLLLARLDAEERPEDLGSVNVRAILADIGELFEALADENGVHLAFEDREQCCVEGSARLLRLLFSNLIENAIRYTPAGGHVRVEVGPRDGECRVAVADTGVGIGRDDLERVFERFYRPERSRGREKGGGAGLGLSICKRIVELHGGSISVESGPGGGTTFTVVLPGLADHP